LLGRLCSAECRENIDGPDLEVGPREHGGVLAIEMPRQQTVKAFADYGGYAAGALGDRVKHFVTINLPTCPGVARSTSQ
jgi:hypothetical protein